MSKEYVLQFNLNNYISVEEPYKKDLGTVIIGKVNDDSGILNVLFDSHKEDIVNFFIELINYVSYLEAKLKALQNGIIDDKTLNMLVKEHKLYKDLEAKLAECEKSKESYRLQNEDHHLKLLQFYSRLGVEAFGADIHEKALETLMIMKEQLAEKEKEMSIKSIIRTLVKYNNLNCTFRDKTNSQIQQCGDVYNSNYGYFNFEDDYDECLNNRNDSRFDIISIDLDNQDKISFALEQLEKVKELLNTDFESTISWIDPYEDGEYLNSMTYNHNNTIKIIDNQIKQLKEMK